MVTFRRIGIIVKPHLPLRLELTQRLADFLRACGATVYLEESLLRIVPERNDFQQLHSMDDIDLLIFLGGDGTILRAIRTYGPPSVPLIGVHAGTVGFLAEFCADDSLNDLESMLKGTYVRDTRTLLSVEILEDQSIVFSSNVLNEVVVSQGMIARVMSLKTMVDGTPLCTYRADGLIVATPTGSTAYALSAGGPIVHPSIEGTVVAPICPHTFNQRPLVIPASSVIEVTIEYPQAEDPAVAASVDAIDPPGSVLVTLDGQTVQTLRRNQSLCVRRASQTVTFLRREGASYYASLAEKLLCGKTLERCSSILDH